MTDSQQYPWKPLSGQEWGRLKIECQETRGQGQGLKGIEVNRTCHSIHERLLEIMLTIPLIVWNMKALRQQVAKI